MIKNFKILLFVFTVFAVLSCCAPSKAVSGDISTGLSAGNSILLEIGNTKDNYELNETTPALNSNLIGDVVISQIQIGNASSSRFVEIYNNTDEPINVTNWCIYHSSKTGSTKNILGCFMSGDKQIHLIFSPRSYSLLTSEKFGIQGDLLTENGLGNITIRDGAVEAGGHVYITDSKRLEHDRLGWGSAEKPETKAMPISPLNTSFVLERKLISPNSYIDSNDNSKDFMDSDLREKYLIGSIFEVVDVCKNLDEIQVIMPSGFMRDGTGNCHLDVCKNIDGLQTKIPEGKILDGPSNCVDYDECSNISGNQETIPNGYIRGDGNSCILGTLPIIITELLPNAVGSDDGNEFIEIYNPNGEEVNLSNYILYIGQDDKSSYGFPDGLKIGANRYLSFSDHDIKFTLVNTTSRASLKTVGGSLVSEVPSYINAKEGQSWALIDGSWEWTNRPTPGEANLESYIKIIDDEITEPEGLKPCAANQYRNPLTNRCKLIPEYEAQLAPCKDGQYRSEETNRCRSIASDVIDLAPCAEGQERNPATNRCRMISSSVAMLVPCAEGQERNPLTNRCRMIASDVAKLVPCAEGQERNPLTNRCRAVPTVLGENDLAPCKEGQERNPETNRCRNIVSIPKADFAPEKVDQLSNDNSAWLLLAGVGGMAVGYGVWEWRRELVKIARKVKSLLHAKK